MRLLFALDQRGRGVDPRHSAMQQKIAHGEISHLTRTDPKTDRVHRRMCPRRTRTLAGQCANASTSFFTAVCSLMSWSKTAPYSSWSFCISLMWLATLFMAFVATKRDNPCAHLQFVTQGIANAEDRFTIQVVVLLAVGVSEGVELLQQQRVLQDSLDGFDQVRLQSGRMLLSGVSLGQEGLEIGVGFCWKSRNISAVHETQK